MLAMQYEIPLPADYDMTVIRKRVATRGHALDHYPGLGIKAYLVRDVAAGAPVNAYAPLYLWTDEAAAGRFLWGGDGFGGIVRDFGRPRVRLWVGGEHQAGKAADASPDAAVKTTIRMAPDLDPQSTATQAAAIIEPLLDHDDVHSVSWAIDPTLWELLIFTLYSTSGHPRRRHDGPEHAQSSENANSITYEVLHLSAPERDALP